MMFAEDRGRDNGRRNRIGDTGPYTPFTPASEPEAEPMKEGDAGRLWSPNPIPAPPAPAEKPKQEPDSLFGFAASLARAAGAPYTGEIREGCDRG